jgi:hypothetical protein
MRLRRLRNAITATALALSVSFGTFIIHPDPAEGAEVLSIWMPPLHVPVNFEHSDTLTTVFWKYAWHVHDANPDHGWVRVQRLLFVGNNHGAKESCNALQDPFHKWQFQFFIRMPLTGFTMHSTKHNVPCQIDTVGSKIISLHTWPRFPYTGGKSPFIVVNVREDRADLGGGDTKHHTQRHFTHPGD